MRRPLSILLISCALAAQGVVPPPALSLTQPPGLNPPAVPATGVVQVQAVHLPADPAGTWTVAMSITGLAAQWGGQGGYDLLLGKYVPQSETFTPGNLAAGCNTSGNEFGAMMDSTGLNMVFEYWAGGTSPHQIMLCTRATTSAAFGQPRPITGISAQPYFDPAIGTVAGKSYVFYVNGGTIVRTSLDVQAAAAFGPAVVVARSVQPGWRANSPSPIFDGRGEVTGLVHHEENGSVNDWMMCSDLDPTTPSLPLLRSNTWKNNGGLVGGRLLSSESTTSSGVIALDSYLLLSTRAGTGELARLDARLPPGPASQSMVSALAIGAGFLPGGLPIGGITGLFGLDPTSIWITLPLGAHAVADGSAQSVISIPNDPSLAGARLSTQAIGWGQGSSVLLSNTAELTIRRVEQPRHFSIPYDGQPHLLSIPLGSYLQGLVFTASPTNVANITVAAQAQSGTDLGVGSVVSPGHSISLGVADAKYVWARLPYVYGAPPAQFDAAPADEDDWLEFWPDLANCGANSGWQIAHMGFMTTSLNCITVDSKRWDKANARYFVSDCPIDFQAIAIQANALTNKYEPVPNIPVLAAGKVTPGGAISVDTICSQSTTGKYQLGIIFLCNSSQQLNPKCLTTVWIKKVKAQADCKKP